MKPITVFQWTAALLMLVLVGCKPSSVVTGQVTCDGQSLEKGNIVFQPADGHGPSEGAAIVAGRYRLEVTPGAKKVQIIGQRTHKYNMNNPSEAALANSAASRGDKSGTYDCIDPTIANAQGNRATVEIKSGSQTFDFALKRSASK